MAIQIKIEEICKKRCGKAKKSLEKCRYCHIYRVIRDSDFHAKMRWTDSLFEDFSTLNNLEDIQESKEMN